MLLQVGERRRATHTQGHRGPRQTQRSARDGNARASMGGRWVRTRQVDRSNAASFPPPSRSVRVKMMNDVKGVSVSVGSVATQQPSQRHQEQVGDIKRAVFSLLARAPPKPGAPNRARPGGAENSFKNGRRWGGGGGHMVGGPAREVAARRLHQGGGGVAQETMVVTGQHLPVGSKDARRHSPPLHSESSVGHALLAHRSMHTETPSSSDGVPMGVLPLVICAQRGAAWSKPQVTCSGEEGRLPFCGANLPQAW